jgi:hypothetical protein
MLYSILIYGSEAAIEAWTEHDESAVLSRHAELRRELTAQGRLGPVMRLMHTTTATTLRPAGGSSIIDGPFAETKEQLLGIYVLECAKLEQAIAAARRLAFESGVLEIRAIALFEPGSVQSDGHRPEAA